MYEHIPFPNFLINEFQINFQMDFLLIDRYRNYFDSD